ncbi:MAG: DEAD/DEAH box helicase [Mucilaginibacter sp.]
MAWPEKLKLNKQLIRSITEAGYLNPKELQLKTLPRIIGGQDIIAVGHEGSGKTTAYILAVLNRLKHTNEGVPLILILVPDKEHVLDVISRFELLNKNKAVSVVGLYASPGTEAQMNALADGADIVVATPDRARAIYLKLGLNLNKIELLIIDDAGQIIKQGLQLPVAELANSITKCQHLVFTDVVHDKLNKMIAPFMKLPAIVEVDEIREAVMELHPQMLYHVPNFGTKLNLLNLFMQDDELFTKTVVFVNTRQTAEKVYSTLQNRLKNAVALLKTGAADFESSPDIRVLVVANENDIEIDLHQIPFIIHFELPVDKDTFINRIKNELPGSDEETLAITFATDLELSQVKKIEQATGQKITPAELPAELVIEKEKTTAKPDEKQAPKRKAPVAEKGEAFHEKKASNSKTYNYSSGLKAKMNNKRKHS